MPLPLLIAVVLQTAPLASQTIDWSKPLPPPSYIPSAAAGPAGIFPCAAISRTIEHFRVGADPEQREMDQCLAATRDATATIRSRRAEIEANPALAGCLGKDAVTCIASLSRFLAVTTSNSVIYHDAQLALHAPERDIYGKPLAGTVSFKVFVPGGAAERPAISVVLGLSDGVHVTDILFLLEQDPIDARTEAEWDGTGTFELATAVLGQSCIGSDKLAFYRRIDNLMKHGDLVTTPRNSITGESASSGTMGIDRLCGAEMNIDSSSTVSRHGHSDSGASLAFYLDRASSRPPSAAKRTAPGLKNPAP